MHVSNNLLALELTADLPESKFIDRWFGEPIRAFIIPTNIFITNNKGFPTLSPAHKQVVAKFFTVS